MKMGNQAQEMQKKVKSADKSVAKKVKITSVKKKTKLDDTEEKNSFRYKRIANYS
jgi:hypothetical protein